MLERCCEDRDRAERDGAFVYLRDYDGWCFVEGPRRRMTFKASYLLDSRGGMQHIGEFYTYHVWPWCFADLPLPDDPQTWMPPTQADGEDGN